MVIKTVLNLAKLKEFKQNSTILSYLKNSYDILGKRQTKPTREHYILNVLKKIAFLLLGRLPSQFFNSMSSYLVYNFLQVISILLSVNNRLLW